MKTRLGLLVYILGLLSTPCEGRLPIRIKKAFTFCYSGQSINANTVLDLNGYYLVKFNDDSLHDRTMWFFDDGIYETWSFIKGDNSYSMYRHKPINYRCGLFRISNDTVTIQQLINYGSSLRNDYHLLEEKFLIVDQHRLLRVAAKYLAHQVKTKYEFKYFADGLGREHVPPAMFVPTGQRQTSDCWLKREYDVKCK